MIVVVVSVGLPVFVEIEPKDSKHLWRREGPGWTPEWSLWESQWKCVKGWCDEEESVDKAELEGKVEKVGRLECLVEVERMG